MNRTTASSKNELGWRVLDRYGDVLLLWAPDAAKLGASWGDAFLVSEWDLEGWLSDPLERGAVLDVYEALSGFSRWTWHGLDPATHDDHVVAAIMRALDTGDLIALRVPPPPILAQVFEKPSDTGKQQSADDWIGIRIVDQAGNPLSGIKYRVKLASGTVVAEGEVDDQGRARVDGISPGQCTIECHELDGRAWTLKTG